MLELKKVVEVEVEAGRREREKWREFMHTLLFCLFTGVANRANKTAARHAQQHLQLHFPSASKSSIVWTFADPVNTGPLHYGARHNSKRCSHSLGRPVTSLDHIMTFSFVDISFLFLSSHLYMGDIV